MGVSLAEQQGASCLVASRASISGVVFSDRGLPQ